MNLLPLQIEHRLLSLLLTQALGNGDADRPSTAGSPGIIAHYNDCMIGISLFESEAKVSDCSRAELLRSAHESSDDGNELDTSHAI